MSWLEQISNYDEGKSSTVGPGGCCCDLSLAASGSWRECWSRFKRVVICGGKSWFVNSGYERDR